MSLVRDIHYKCIDHPIYKYELLLPVEYNVDITGIPILHEFFMLNDVGIVTAEVGYRWDGASGPTIDTPSNMRGSLFHDILWQMLAEGLLPETYRRHSNKIMKQIFKKDGMSAFRAWYYYNAVNMFGTAYLVSKRKKLATM